MPKINPDKPSKKKLWLLVSVSLLLAASVIFLVVLSAPYWKALSLPENQERLQSWIAELGFKGWILFFCLQMLQIIIAFIPGEPIQMMAGVLYGAWGGILTWLAGSVCASILVFIIVRKGGERLVHKLFGKDKLEKFSFLRDSHQIEMITLILFLIPGMPKDLLTYLGGLTSIKLWKFIAISNLARIPALAASALLGSSASRGNMGLTLIISLLAIATAVIGVIFRDKLTSWLHQHGRTSL